MNDARAMPDSILLAVPDEWSEFPLTAAEFGTYRTKVLSKLADEGLSRFEQRTVEIFLANVFRSTESQNLVYAAGLFQLLEGNGDGRPIPLLASVTASTMLRRDLGTDVPLLPEVLVKAFSTDRGKSDSTIAFTHIEAPAVSIVGGSEAAKLVRMMRIDKPGRKVQSLFVETYLIPVAEGDGVVILQFSTPSLDYAREFSELFGKVASTFQLLYPSDPTPTPDIGSQVEST